jgi:hypothetical protein
MTRSFTAATAGALVLLCPFGVGTARADNLNGDVIACAVDRPCITELYQDGTTLVIGWDGEGDWGHYNFRWGRPGRDETQSETDGGTSGSFRITNVNPGMTYTVKVQGCNRDLFGNSSCTPWEEDLYTTASALPYGPDTCKQGFVWREAQPTDHVCVTPDIRTQTADENNLADQRRDPNGGAYGPDTCLVGFVWREAFADDHVCVPPESRDQAHADNAAATSRRAA